MNETTTQQQTTGNDNPTTQQREITQQSLEDQTERQQQEQNQNDNDERGEQRREEESETNDEISLDPSELNFDEDELEINDEEDETSSTTDFGNKLLRKFEGLDKSTTDELPTPQTWTQVHSRQHIPWNSISIDNDILNMTSKISDYDVLFDLTEKMVPISLLTIATGEKRQLAVIHSITKFEVNGHKRYLGLTGNRTRGTPINLLPHKLFKSTTTQVPTLQSLCGITEPGQPLSSELSICNTIALPPYVAKFIMSTNTTSAEEVYRRLLLTLLKKDKHIYDTKDELRDMGIDDLKLTQHCLPVLQHLYYFANARSSRTAGFTLADDDAANEWVTDLDSRLANGTLANEETNMRPRDDELNRPKVSFDESEGNQSRQRNSSHTTTRQTTDSHQNNRQPAHFTFTGDVDPNKQQSTGSQTPPNASETRQTSNSDLTYAIQNMTNHQSRFTSQMERLVNATADKFSEEGTKKIGNIIKQVICNASTINGADPIDELTPFAKDILSLSGDQPLTLINILFQRNKIRAKATPKLVSAARKGNLTYDNGIPDGFSLTQLPQSLQGTDIEQLDIPRLMNMEENGTITEVDTISINKSILPISRTLHYLQDKTKAWAIFCKEYFGPLSLIGQEAQSWATWLEENFNELQETRASCDRDLPIKIELAISECFNRTFRTAMLGVPDESLYQDELRDQILRNTAYLHIPHAVKDTLDKATKRKSEQSNPQTNKRSRTTSNKVTHDNQPRELLLTQDQYRSKAIPYIQSNKDKLPKYDNSTEDCLKFTLLGYCNPECPRKKAHNKVNKGTKRYDNLLKFKNEIFQASKQDFAQGE